MNDLIALLKNYDCDNINDLIDYISYLEGVQADYERLKKELNSLINIVNKFYY